MSIELPPLPPLPSAQSDQAEWARYLDIASLYVSRESVEATDRQATQTAALTAASVRHAELLQTMNSVPSDGFSEVFVMGLLRLVLGKPEAT